jgi:hypothetical protein
MAKQTMREKTAGTLTFFFPEKRDRETPPEVTLMVRRVGEEEWHAGLAMCSKDDMFEKRFGRRVAFHRLQGCPIRDHYPVGLIRQIAERLDNVTKRHSFTFSTPTIQSLPDITQRLVDMRVE